CESRLCLSELEEPLHRRRGRAQRDTVAMQLDHPQEGAQAARIEELDFSEIEDETLDVVVGHGGVNGGEEIILDGGVELAVDPHAGGRRLERQGPVRHHAAMVAVAGATGGFAAVAIR
ncbi:MAG: hypothetical protein QOD72_1120, partial [Acidimicrobiaceae bacterium]|nr:hypothetical protein [Acidimicrobiaceae bacterium]